jgi:hypothetical protein
MMAGRTRLHATCVALGESGLLLVGAPGTGKSDLALRLVDRGALLVADDQTEIAAMEGKLIASCPPGFAGLIEVRGLGLLRLPARGAVRLRLGLDLDSAPQRLPARPWPMRDILGIALPCLPFDARAPSAPLVAELALRALLGEVAVRA